jgi:hypothetical protein
VESSDEANRHSCIVPLARTDEAMGTLRMTNDRKKQELYICEAQTNWKFSSSSMSNSSIVHVAATTLWMKQVDWPMVNRVVPGDMVSEVRNFVPMATILLYADDVVPTVHGVLRKKDRHPFMAAKQQHLFVYFFVFSYLVVPINSNVNCS